jgi:SAM-dependent methyltransferase
MTGPWNLTAGEWSAVLATDQSPTRLAETLLARGQIVPWSELLVERTADCQTVLDLGSGRGDHSARLARHGRLPTLVDWSLQNIDFSRRMFEECGVRGRFFVADITKRLPFESNSIDAVFSCGVLEYFDERQVQAILDEAFRVARKRVIALVPNAWSVAYRLGKWYMERRGSWNWGGEVPSHSLQRAFDRAGSVHTSELTLSARHSLNFLRAMPFGSRVERGCIRLFGMQHDARPAWCRQGYLLATIGEKPREVAW